MWPRTLDLTIDECRKVMRRLELEAYSRMIDTFRAQGVLDEDKLRVLRELRAMLKIREDRHRSEVRRAANDEQLGTVAEMIHGNDAIVQWTREGKRGAPPLYRSRPYSALSIAAEAASNFGYQLNRQLPLPSILKRDPSCYNSELPLKTNLVQTDPNRGTPIKRSATISHKEDRPLNSNTGPGINTTAKTTKLASSSPTLPCHPKYRKIQMKREKAKTVRQSSVSTASSSSHSSSVDAGVAKPSLGQIQGATRTPKVVNSFERGPKKKNFGHLPEEAGFRIEERIRNKDLMPQIATSKKDITSNLTKLSQLVSPQNSPNMSAMLYAEAAAAMASNNLPTSGSVNVTSAGSTVNKYPKLQNPTQIEWQNSSTIEGKKVIFPQKAPNFIKIKKPDASTVFITSSSSSNTTALAAMATTARAGSLVAAPQTNVKPKVQISQTNLAPGSLNSFSSKKAINLKNLGNGRPSPTTTTIYSPHLATSKASSHILNGLSNSGPVFFAQQNDSDDVITISDVETTTRRPSTYHSSEEDSSEPELINGNGEVQKNRMENGNKKIIELYEAIHDGRDMMMEEFITTEDNSDVIMDAIIVEDKDGSLILDEHNSSDKIIIEMHDNSEIIEEDDGGELVTEEYIEADAGDAEIYNYSVTENGIVLSNGGLEKVGTDYEFLLDNANASQILVEEVDLNGQQQIRKVTLEEWNGMVAGHLIG